MQVMQGNTMVIDNSCDINWPLEISISFVFVQFKLQGFHAKAPRTLELNLPFWDFSLLKVLGYLAIIVQPSIPASWYGQNSWIRTFWSRVQPSIYSWSQHSSVRVNCIAIGVNACPIRVIVSGSAVAIIDCCGRRNCTSIWCVNDTILINARSTRIIKNVAHTRTGSRTSLCLSFLSR